MSKEEELAMLTEETRLAEEQLRLTNERNEKMADAILKMSNAEIDLMLEAAVIERIAAFVEDQDEPGLADAIRDGAWR